MGYNPSINSMVHFIGSWILVLGELHAAQNTEMMDAASSNRTLFGFCVSYYSNYQNQKVAARVDSLRQEALSLNNELSRLGVFKRRSSAID